MSSAQEISDEIHNTLDRGRVKSKEYKKLFSDLKRKNQQKVDSLFRKTHQEVFEKRNCLECANCCKTTSPLFFNKDIARLAKHLKMSEESFVSTYLTQDEDGDMVLQKSPCAFLLEDNTCFVYENRPKACSEYPHTDRKNITAIANLTIKNAEICPAVVDVLEKIKDLADKRQLI